MKVSGCLVSLYVVYLSVFECACKKNLHTVLYYFCIYFDFCPRNLFWACGPNFPSVRSATGDQWCPVYARWIVPKCQNLWSRRQLLRLSVFSWSNCGCINWEFLEIAYFRWSLDAYAVCLKWVTLFSVSSILGKSDDNQPYFFAVVCGFCVCFCRRPLSLVFSNKRQACVVTDTCSSWTYLYIVLAITEIQ